MNFESLSFGKTEKPINTSQVTRDEDWSNFHIKPDRPIKQIPDNQPPISPQEEFELYEKIQVGFTGKSEKLHNHEIEVTEKDLKLIALETLTLPDFTPIRNKIQNVTIEENPDAHMGRVFIATLHDSQNEPIKRFIIKASLDGLNGGDLTAQCFAQKLCQQQGIKVPTIYMEPQVGGADSKVRIMTEEFVEGTVASKLTNPEELHQFYGKLGAYIGEVHAMEVSGWGKITTSNPNQEPLHATFQDQASYSKNISKTTSLIPSQKLAKYTNIIEQSNKENFFHRPPALIHSDCHLGNVILTTDGQICVIDWGAAVLDTPLADLQYFIIGSKESNKVRPPAYVSIPLGGRYPVIPEEYRDDFLRGYISTNNSIFSSVEDFNAPRLKHELFSAKFDTLRAHAGWNDVFGTNPEGQWLKLILDATSETYESLQETKALIG